MASTPSHVHHVSEVCVLPQGATLDMLDDDVRLFTLTVVWRGTHQGHPRGRGGYAVKGRIDFLARAGKWGWPETYQQWQYRWATLKEATAAAEAAIDALTFNGITYPQMREHLAARRAEREARAAGMPARGV